MQTDILPHSLNLLISEFKDRIAALQQEIISIINNYQTAKNNCTKKIDKNNVILIDNKRHELFNNYIYYHQSTNIFIKNYHIAVMLHINAIKKYQILFPQVIGYINRLTKFSKQNMRDFQCEFTKEKNSFYLSCTL